MASVEIMTARMLEGMRAACQLAAETLVLVGERIEPGITTQSIDDFVRDFTAARGAKCSTLGYKGFTANCCTSLNEVVCHGIPGPRVLKDGDIINVDITSYFPTVNGYHGDNSAMFYVGEPSDDAKHVVEVARHSLEVGIAAVRAGARIGDIGAAIQRYAEGEGCSVVRDYVGHGVGRNFHMPPQVPHYGRAGSGIRLRPGMVFTIEPMINLGDWRTELQSDGWTVLTADRSLTAQFEHTIAVTESGCEVLTARDAVLANSEDKEWSRLGPLASPAGLSKSA